jgi:hypothetical protein
VQTPKLGAREYRPAFVPDDLLRVQKADPQQAVEHFKRSLKTCKTNP